MINITLSNIADYVSYDKSSCAAVNDRLVILYRRAMQAGIIESGEHIHIHGDVDDVLNRDNWHEFISTNSDSDGEYDNLPMPSLADFGDMVVIEDDEKPKHEEKPKRKNDEIWTITEKEFGKLIVLAFLSIPGLAVMALIANQSPDTTASQVSAVMNFFVDVLPEIQVLGGAAFMSVLGIWIAVKIVEFLSE